MRISLVVLASVDIQARARLLQLLVVKLLRSMGSNNSLWYSSSSGVEAVCLKQLRMLVANSFLTTRMAIAKSRFLRRALVRLHATSSSSK